MDNMIMYAKCFRGFPNSDGTGFDTSGIAVYQIVGSYGTAEKMPSSIRDTFDSFCDNFNGIEDPVFAHFNLDVRLRRMPFQLNQEDMERRIILTTNDSDYLDVVNGLKDLAEQKEILIVLDHHLDNIIDRWMGYVVRNGKGF